MSDVMLFGVLRMPYDMAMDGEIARRQFYGRAQEAADRIKELERKNAELELAHQRTKSSLNTASNALAHAESQAAEYRCKTGELENELRRVKLDLEEIALLAPAGSLAQHKAVESLKSIGTKGAATTKTQSEVSSYAVPHKERGGPSDLPPTLGRFDRMADS